MGKVDKQLIEIIDKLNDILELKIHNNNYEEWVRNLKNRFEGIVYLQATEKFSGYIDYPYKMLMNDGYIRIFTRDFQVSKLEHRYLMEKKLGRKLSYLEVVHHIDGNKSNNHINNLSPMSYEKHSGLHGKIKHSKSLDRSDYRKKLKIELKAINNH